jgi:uncharacterized protein with HEPN domain
MRREELYLRDIREASDSISRFILGLTPAEFRKSDLVGSAVVQKLAVIWRGSRTRFRGPAVAAS